MTILYRAIVVMVFALTLWNMYDEKELKNQANAALVLIPLLLRALMIK